MVLRNSVLKRLGRKPGYQEVTRGKLKQKSDVEEDLNADLVMCCVDPLN